MTADEIAAHFGISRWTIYDLVQRGVIPRPYGGRRYAHYGQEHYDALETYLEASRKRRPAVRPPRKVRRKAFSNTTRAKVWELCGGLCTYCGAALNPFLNFHIDHVIPLARGGADALENLVGACSFCNTSKGDGELETQYQIDI